MRNLELALRFITQNATLVDAYNKAKKETKKFVRASREDFQSLSRAWNSTAGKLGAVGLGFGTYKIISDSARLDARLGRIGQTASASKEQIALLRKELYTMATQTGKDVGQLADGFDKMVQSGASFKESLATITAINIATSVTGASADTLANALTTAATAFKFDLSKPDTATLLLDKMTMAGRLGNAELENLSDIFSRVAVNSRSAGMGFEQTLAFIEALSRMEKAPDRLATLADSTIRLFTNMQYMKRAEKSGIKFFNADGTRRDAFAVLEDIKKKYQSFDTVQKKAIYLNKLLKGADLDTVKGIRTLVDGDLLDAGKQFTDQIRDASGLLSKDLNGAMDNAADQAARLKQLLGAAGDSFAKPINKVAANALQFSMDKMGMNGFDFAGLGTAGVLASWLVGRRVKGAFGKWMSGGVDTAAGVAQGKMLEAAAGVTPVFVTNWEGRGSMSFAGSPSGKWQEYLPGIGTGVGAGVGAGSGAGVATAAAIAAVAAPVAMGLLIGGGLFAIALREYKLWKQREDDAEFYAKTGLNRHITRDRNRTFGDQMTGASVDSVLSGKSDRISGMLYKAEAQSTFNDIRLNVFIDESGKVVTQADGKHTTTDVNVKRGKHDYVTQADRIFGVTR
jgi:TP901 family phage tail tape measure protein